MKLNKKMIKKKKKNNKKTKKVIKNNVEVVSEKIAFILDKADFKFIKNIATILTPKVALRICNEVSDIEETGGLTDPTQPNRKLTKLESYLYLIEHDSSISENKKNTVLKKKDSTLPEIAPTKLSKKNRKKIRNKVKSIQNELDKLCLNQMKNQSNNLAGNYFAIQTLNKLDQQQSQNNGTGFSANSFIKPSTFNLNLNNGTVTLTPNYSNQLISNPRLDLNQIDFYGTINSKSQDNISSSLQSSNLQNPNLLNNNSTLQASLRNVQINDTQNYNLNINLNVHPSKNTIQANNTPNNVQVNNAQDIVKVPQLPPSSTTEISVANLFSADFK